MSYTLRPGGASYNFAPKNTGFVRLKSLDGTNYTGVFPQDGSAVRVEAVRVLGALEFSGLKDGGLLELAKFKKDIIVESVDVESGVVISATNVILPGIPAQSAPSVPFRLAAGADLQFVTSTNTTNKSIMIGLREANKGDGL